jgi:hypothetical protein
MRPPQTERPAERMALHAGGLGREGEAALAEALAEDLCVEAELVAKVVADAGDIDAGAVGDFLDGGGLVTALREDLAGGGEEGLASIASNGGWGSGCGRRHGMWV